MKIAVERISEELVKPSIPTPDRLRHLYFSFIDQHTPKVSISFVYFFAKESTTTNLQKSNQLKKSLSEALAIFYPLAGRVRNESYIECNDEGFLFIEAKSSCTLFDVLKDQNPVNFNLFTPFRPADAGDWAGFSQVTFFACGGLALSFGMSHKLGDASSMFTFLNSWAAIAKGNTKAISAPPFGHATTFPPINMPKLDYGIMFVKEKLVTKIFVFDRSSIESLKKQSTTANGEGRRLSRVESLTGLIIGRFMASTKAGKTNNWKCAVIQAIDLRSKMDPPMAKNTFGNLATAATVEGILDVKEEYHIEILERLRESIRIVVEKYRKIKEDKEQVWNFLKRMMQTYGEEEVVSLSFTSLHNFPIYEADFGWGKPLWVGTTPLIAKNQVQFFGSRDGESIEAWVSLCEEDMAKFEADELLHRYVSSSGILDIHSRL